MLPQRLDLVRDFEEPLVDGGSFAGRPVEMERRSPSFTPLAR
jgi:hypothetical protein